MNKVYNILDLSGESRWWTVHPASKQRSEGEKVRVGDDLILVSVATERYLVSAREQLGSLTNLLLFYCPHFAESNRITVKTYK